jgi:GTPase
VTAVPDHDRSVLHGACKSMIFIVNVAVGVEDNGYLRGLHRTDLEGSLATLRAMAREVYAATVLLEEIPGARGGTCALVRVHRMCVDEASYMDLRIAGIPDLTQTNVYRIIDKS